MLNAGGNVVLFRHTTAPLFLFRAAQRVHARIELHLEGLQLLQLVEHLACFGVAPVLQRVRVGVHVVHDVVEQRFRVAERLLLGAVAVLGDALGSSGVNRLLSALD